MKVETIRLESYVGVETRIPLTSPPESDGSRLMIVLPGYKLDGALRLLAAKMERYHGYDTLLVQYGFQAAKSRFELEDLPKIHREAQQAVEYALAGRDYREIVIAGKLIGTPIAAALANTLSNVSKVVLLTPFQDSHRLIENVPTLAVVSTADASYDAGTVKNSPTLQWQVLDESVHAMIKADGNMMASLNAYFEITEACESFLLS